LSTIAAVRALTPEQAKGHLPVHIHPVVTFFNAVSGDLFLHDETGGIWMSWKPSDPVPVPGQELDLYASTSFSFAIDIERAHWTVARRGALPTAKRVSYEQMSSTAEDSRWVEVEGIVRQAAYLNRIPTERLLWMDLAMPGGHVDVLIPWDGGTSVPPGLVDRKVAVRGVCGAGTNSKNQLVSVVLFVPELGQIRTLEAPDPQSFAGAPLPIGSLQKFGFRNPQGHRVKLAGTVTALLRGRGFYLRDDSDSIYVATRQNLSIEPGDRVEALGFVKLEPPRILLEDAFFRKTAGGGTLRPVALTPAKVMSGIYDSDLVSLEGRVAGQSNLPRQQTIMLQSDRTIFPVVYVGLRSPSRLPANGSLVRVSGICVNEANDLGQITGFRILVEDERSVFTIRSAPWWTGKRVLNLLAILGSAVALALIWVGVLRRRVAHQTRLISEKLAQEKSLKHAAEQASRAKSDFLANMSHEIRTPMNAILGFTDLLMETPLNEEQRDYISTVQSSSRSLTHILNEILDFSKIESGRMVLEKLPFHLSGCVRQVVQLITPEAARKRLRAEIDIADDVPDKLIGDQHRLHQVLLNLLSNGLKFTDSGFLRVQVVCISRTPQSVELKFSVIDSGIGIPPEAQQKIFESFSQADESTTRRYGGTGLGLAICSRLVALFGGTIWLESQMGVGSCFHFTAHFLLPDASAEEEEASGRQQAVGI
jgi:signal transduction histidine kinase